MLGQSAQVKLGFTAIVLILALLSVVVAQEIATNGLPTGEVILPQQGNAVDLDLINLKIISPLYEEIISGTGIVILGVEPRDKITSAYFEIAGNETELSMSNNFSSEFDSKAFENGDYQFTATVCINDSCKSETIPIRVSNPSSKGEPEFSPSISPAVGSGVPEIIPRTVKVRGSNIFSALTLFSEEGIVKGSGTDFFEIERGTYNAQIDFFDSAISLLELKNLQVQKEGTLVETKSVDITKLEIPQAGLEWVQVHALNTNYSFSSGELTLIPPSSSVYLFRCRDFDYEAENCRGSFENVSRVVPLEKFVVPFDSVSKAVGFAKIKPKGIVNDSDQNVFVKPSIVEVADFNSIMPEEDLLGIDFEKIRGNLPHGLYSLKDTESRQSEADAFVNPNFPYFSIETNPITAKKSFVIDPVTYSAKWLETGFPTTKLVSSQSEALYELYLEVYYQKSKSFGNAGLSAALVEYNDEEVMGNSGDIIHFTDSGLVPGSGLFEIKHADILLQNPGFVEGSQDVNFVGKKISARFRSASGAKFLRIFFVFNQVEPSQSTGSFYFDKISLKKVVENEG